MAYKLYCSKVKKGRTLTNFHYKIHNLLWRLRYMCLCSVILIVSALSPKTIKSDLILLTSVLIKNIWFLKKEVKLTNVICMSCMIGIWPPHTHRHVVELELTLLARITSIFYSVKQPDAEFSHCCFTAFTISSLFCSY